MCNTYRSRQRTCQTPTHEGQLHIDARDRVTKVQLTGWHLRLYAYTVSQENAYCDYAPYIIKTVNRPKRSVTGL